MTKQEKQKVYEQVSLAIQRLHAAKGNIIVVYVPPDMSQSQRELFADITRPVTQHHEVTMMIVDQETKLQELNETEMNKLGWVRDPAVPHGRTLN